MSTISGEGPLEGLDRLDPPPAEIHLHPDDARELGIEVDLEELERTAAKGIAAARRPSGAKAGDGVRKDGTIVPRNRAERRARLKVLRRKARRREGGAE